MNTFQQINRKPKKKQEKKQKPISLKEQLKDYLPKDLNALLYALFITAYLMCAVIRFAHTSDTTMLTVILPYLSAYAGIHKVAPLLPWSKKEEKQKN